MDSKAKTRSAGCAAYMAPERINPPNPNKPDYDIRADVWSLGITLVELATGSFPYKDCKTEFEVLTKVIQDDPPCLPPNQGFSTEFRAFVHDCLLKNHKDRPKYKKLLEHPFILKYRDMEVDVGAWYSKVSNHSGDPNKVPSDLALSTARKSSLEQRHEPQSFKPQPSPRMVKAWRAAGGSLPGTTAPDSESKQGPPDTFSRLKFYTGREAGGEPQQRYDNPRLTELASPRTNATSARYGDTGRGLVDTSRLNGSLGRNSFSSSSSSYHRPEPTSLLARPPYGASRSHEAAPGPASRSYTETAREARDCGSAAATRGAAQRKYSFETLDSPRDYHYTPKGSRKLYGAESGGAELRARLDSPRESGAGSGAGSGAAGRKYPGLPVPEPPVPSRGREQDRRPDSARTFIPSSWKLGSWTLSSPLNLRKFRTSSSDRATTFERSRRLQPGYRSLNERDKQFYSSSGKSDKL